MQNEKPSLIKYIKAQNNDLYKATGVIYDNKLNKIFVENNYYKIKSLFDNIYILLYLLLIYYGESLLIEILSPIIQNYINNIQNGPYDPNMGVKMIPIHLIVQILLFIYFLIIIPAIIKLFKLLSGLRWFFINYSIIENLDAINVPQRKISFYEFYSFKMAFKSDHIFYKGSKVFNNIVTKYLHLKDDKMYLLTVTKYIYHLYLIILIPVIIAININNKDNVILLLLLITIVLCLLSYVITYMVWKKQIKR